PHDLETVLVTGVVTAGDHHTAVGVEMMNTEIHEGCRTDTDVDHLGTRFDQTVDQRLEQACPGAPTIAAHHDARRISGLLPRAKHTRQTATDLANQIIAQIAVCNASNIVFAKDVSDHRAGPYTSPPSVQSAQGDPSFFASARSIIARQSARNAKPS